jgi:ATP-dependent DNA helicase RecG
MRTSANVSDQSPLSNTAGERLNILRETSDGFIIAEKDLELRGPGEMMGTRQTVRDFQ